MITTFSGAVRLYRFCALMIYGYVDGTIICPPKHLCEDDDGESSSKAALTVNPEYTKWVKQDSLILCWINSTLSETIVENLWLTYIQRCLAEDGTSPPHSISVTPSATPATNPIHEEGQYAHY